MEPSWVMSEKERKEYNKQLDEKRKNKQSGSQTSGEFTVNIKTESHLFIKDYLWSINANINLIPGTGSPEIQGYHI